MQNLNVHCSPTRRHELPQLLSVVEVAELLGVSTKKVYRLIGSGELPALRLGDHKGAAVRIDRGELLAASSLLELGSKGLIGPCPDSPS